MDEGKTGDATHLSEVVPGPEELDRAAKRALSRARSHFRGAEVLARARKFPLAYSILVLSFEELGKAIVLKLAADRVISFDPRDKGGGNYVDLKTLFRGRESHQVKQAVVGVVAVQIVALIRLVELFRRETGETPTEREAEQLVVELAYPRRPPPDYTIDEETITKGQKIRVELQEFWNGIPKLDGWKQDGFYTNLAPFSGERGLTEPRRAVNYHDFHETLSDLLEIGRVIVVTPTSREQIARMKAMERMREFAFTHA